MFNTLELARLFYYFGINEQLSTIESLLKEHLPEQIQALQ
jgi:hypothetical protein